MLGLNVDPLVTCGSGGLGNWKENFDKLHGSQVAARAV